MSARHLQRGRGHLWPTPVDTWSGKLPEQHLQTVPPTSSDVCWSQQSSPSAWYSPPLAVCRVRVCYVHTKNMTLHACVRTRVCARTHTLQAGGPLLASVTVATRTAERNSISHLQQAEKSRSSDALLQLPVWGPMKQIQMAGVCQVRTGPCAECATRR